MSSPDLFLLNPDPSQDEIHRQNVFTLKVPPKTDIFASPTIGYHFSAPIAYKCLPTRNFSKARATITMPFTLNCLPTTRVENPTLQFDQAGLVFVFLDPKFPAPCLANPVSGKTENPHPKWIKADVEVWEGKTFGSVVVREKWSDWSLFAVPSSADAVEVTLTIEMQRLGDALMIYKILGTERELGRKVPWGFLEGETTETVWIGVYGARPDPYDEAQGKNLVALFENFVIEDVEIKGILIDGPGIRSQLELIICQCEA
jgi:hypothetical protein